jgi:group I intron endonuclease
MIIYKTTNLKNGKIYIGKDIHNNPNYLGSGKILKQAFEKYGKENFVKEIIDTENSIEELNKKEKYWIAYYQSQKREIGYNISKGGDGGDIFTNNPDKEEIRKKFKNNNGFRGHQHSDETKKKLSEMFKGRIMTPEWREKNSN